MDRDEFEMPPDLQEARSIRYASLLGIAQLSSGHWALFSSSRLGPESFRNEITIQVELEHLIQKIRELAAAERAQRAQEELEYEERRAQLAAGPAVTGVSTKSLEDMGL